MGKALPWLGAKNRRIAMFDRSISISTSIQNRKIGGKKSHNGLRKIWKIAFQNREFDLDLKLARREVGQSQGSWRVDPCLAQTRPGTDCTGVCYSH